MSSTHFTRPAPENASSIGSLDLWLGWAWDFPTNYLLQVRGRNRGKIYSMPIDLLEIAGKRYPVAPRGRTPRVRNLAAAGEVTLKKGGQRQEFRLSSFKPSGSWCRVSSV